MEGLDFPESIKKIRELALEFGKMKEKHEKGTEKGIAVKFSNLWKAHEMKNYKDQLITKISDDKGVSMKKLNKVWELEKERGKLEKDHQKGKKKYKGKWIWKEIRDRKQHVDELIEDIMKSASSYLD